MRMTWDASSRFEARVEESQADVQEVGNKTMNFVLHNITSTFEFCQRFVQVKEPAELLRLLNDFIQSQMQILSEQVRNLGLALSKVAIEGIKGRKRANWRPNRSAIVDANPATGN